MKSELISIRPDARKESNGCHGELEREEWRPVKGYEGLCEVSSFGRVKSLERTVPNGSKSGRLILEKHLTTYPDKDGYPRVALCRNRKIKLCGVHRLVMEAFVPNPHNLPCVNHRNEVKTSNYPDNMEWCTVGYNNTYGTKLKRQAENQRGQKRPTVANKLRGIKRSEETKQRSKESKRHKMKPVLQYTLDGVFVAEYESTKEAGRQTGIHYGNICNCCNGRFHTAGGFVWHYKK